MTPKLGRALGFAVAVLLLPIALPVLLLDRIAHGLIFVAWQLCHGLKGTRVLAVYSDGPKWKDHFESTVLPLVADHALVVNTTATPAWSGSGSIARRVHRLWGGRRHHSPIVIYFPASVGRVKVLRFHEGYLRNAHNGDSSMTEATIATLKSLCNDA